MDEKTRQFVLGLTKLTRETGITVTATKYQLHFLPDLILQMLAESVTDTSWR